MNKRAIPLRPCIFPARAWWLAAVCAVVAANPALAQIPPANQPPAAKASPLATQVPLTSDLVQSFIKSFPEVRKTTDALSAKYKMSSQPAVASPVGAFGAWMTIAAAQADLNGTVAKFGFKSFSDWVSVMTSVGAALAFGASDSPDAGMSQVIAAVQANPKLTDAQKQQVIAQMQKASPQIAANRPSQQNIDVVKPFAIELKALFK